MNAKEFRSRQVQQSRPSNSAANSLPNSLPNRASYDSSNAYMMSNTMAIGGYPYEAVPVQASSPRVIYSQPRLVQQTHVGVQMQGSFVPGLAQPIRGQVPSAPAVYGIQMPRAGSYQVTNGLPGGMMPNQWTGLPIQNQVVNPPMPGMVWGNQIVPAPPVRHVSDSHMGGHYETARLDMGMGVPTRKRLVSSSSAPEGSPSSGSESGTGRSHGAVSAPKKVKKARKPDSDEGNLNGEQRLMIVFDSYGELTKHPQKMGRKQGFIPDGVCGTFSMYGESWAFKVTHEELARCEDGEERVRIRWTVTNKVSGVSHSVVESPSDAMKRDIRGVSLCNKVFVQAMELRAQEYEAMVEKEKNSENPNMLKISNYRSRAQCLRPQRFSEGPLLFGLRHRCVQENMVIDRAA